MSLQDSHKRSLAKGLSWRATGTLDTILISYLVTGRPTLALTIGAIEVFTKVALYYAHERVWQKVRWGRVNDARQNADTPARSLFKGLSWRATGTLDTLLVSFAVTGQIETALAIGFVEIFTKLVLYYGHERLWQKIAWGQSQTVQA